MNPRFTLRLKPGRDDDIIDWLESLGEGERSFFMRQAIRTAILSERMQLPFPIPDPPHKENVEAKDDCINKDIFTNTIECMDERLHRLTNQF